MNFWLSHLKLHPLQHKSKKKSLISHFNLPFKSTSPLHVGLSPELKVSAEIIILILFSHFREIHGVDYF